MPRYRTGRRRLPGLSDQRVLCQRHCCAAARLPYVVCRKLPPQTRRLLALIDELVAAECRRLKMERADFRFSRRDVRRHSGWSATQVRVHLDRLQEMEYAIVHHGGRGQTFVYELVYEAGEICGYDLNLAGPEANLTGPKRPQNGGVAAPWRTHETRMNTGANGVFAENREKRAYAEA
jgi:hypothetical protein